jgi:hypothetical protein
MRAMRVVLVAVGLSVAVMACSSDSKSSTTVTSSGSEAPEDKRASAAEVAKGLKEIEATAKAMVAAGTDKAQLKEADEKIEPVWEEIEGTVKANDSDAYITFEDAFAVLEKAADDGDAAKVQSGSDSVSKAVAEYLVKYPG